MLYGPDGNIISGQGRNGNRVDGFQLADGVVVCEAASRKLHERVKNDARFRELLEQADRESYELRRRKWAEGGMQGPAPKFEVSEHLALVKRGNNAPDAVWKNQAFGEKVMRERAKNENLEGSAAGYANLNK
jgi:hypothetical protein